MLSLCHDPTTMRFLKTLCVPLLLGFPFALTAQQVRLVTSPFDAGNGTLRNTISEALDGDTIRFSGVSSITLTSAGIEYNKDLVIEGPGMDQLTLSGNDQFVVLRVLGGSTRLSGLTIQNGRNPFGSVQAGGGMGFTGDTLVVSEVRFIACDQSGLGGFVREGGGLYASGDHVRVIDCEFVENTLLMGATDDGMAHGGGAAIRSDDFEVVGSLFTGNEARGRRSQTGANGFGGGLYVEGLGRIRACNFVANVANAVTYMTGNPPQNSVARGGGVFVAAGSEVVLEDCAVDDNILLGSATGQPRWHGAGIAAVFADVTLVDCQVTNNRATLFGGAQTESRGGGVYINDGLLVANDCTFQRNEARDGSAVFHTQVSNFQPRQGIVMGRCRILDGQGNVSSGAIHTSAAKVIDLQEVEIGGNGQRGLYYRQGDTLRVDRCLFERNRGGAWLEALATNENVFLNCTFHRNGADQGGAIRASLNTTFQLVNCSLVDDSLTAPGTSGRELYLDNSTVLLKNCILAETFAHGSTAFGGPNAVALSAGGNVCNDPSLGGVLVVGSDASDEEPGLGVFADHGGYTRTWSLLPSSTCIDRGGSDTLSVDQRGFVRDVSSDAGAYEFGAADPAIVVTGISEDILLCVNEILELAVAAESALGINYQWFLNGEEIPGAEDAAYSVQVGLDDAGIYTCQLTNGFGSVEAGPVVVQVSVCTGVAGGAGEGFTAAPNPFTDRLELRIANGPRGVLVLRDASGRAVRTTSIVGSTMTMDTGGLRPGLYLAELHDAQGRAAVLRVVKVD